MGELILAFTGRDAPGITARISRVLSQSGARLSDSAMVLDAILYLLGITGRDVVSLENE